MKHEIFGDLAPIGTQYSDGLYVTFRDSDVHAVYASVGDVPPSSLSNPTVISDIKNCALIPIVLQYGHMFEEYLSGILSMHEAATLSSQVITFIVPPKAREISEYEFFLKHLEAYGVNFIYCSAAEEFSTFRFSNLHLVEAVDRNAHTMSLVRDFCLYVSDKLVDRSDVAGCSYLSRQSGVDSQDLDDGELEWLANSRHLKYTATQSRVNEESTLINYFLAKGDTEIRLSEDFASFEDQVRFFSSLKTLISPSGSGLFNLFFMKPGSAIIELATPLGTHFGNGNYSSAYHLQYPLYSFISGLNYIGLPHSREPREIINKLELLHESIF
jgi:hypothetical protein